MPSSTSSPVFITGASAGIGAAIARLALAQGAEVWGTARSEARLAELAEHERFHPVVLDLDDAVGALSAYREAAVAAGGFAVVINNAGYGTLGSFAEVEFAVWRQQLNAMLVNTAALAQAQLADLRRRAQGGVLVNVASLATEFPLPYMTGYNIAKAGLSALSESLLIETRHTGVSVIDFRPGDFRTGFNQSMQRPTHSADPAATADQEAAWNALEANLNAAPPPERAARDLWRAIERRHRGMLRSGDWFQTVLAPLFQRLVPTALARAVRWRYFGLR
ncbi:SDR family NAD(P)-dependent oxidoreductase [Actomonas aquatica]|uniref:SDR family NAD(P)-dependent oxidoreductase n=1 Tax=Actomonas aquatica TaxID=2866162 RepID=A0ABZ1CB42_9BACT|nr:SDR family NAD(P)-dependent oxidoreductase [Opitutus sp. WL0086]WRQ88537.1 SDR family NAD(P)-dependent oxidoreductase [Opitutus sp. WL0086]